MDQSNESVGEKQLFDHLGNHTQTHPEFAGTICFWNVIKQHYRAGIGYALHPLYEKKRDNSGSYDGCLNYGFSVMKLHSVEANVSQNAPSIRL